MAGRSRIRREARRMNSARRVNERGRTTCEQFCARMSGNVLISGETDRKAILLSMIQEYDRRRDLPTIVLTNDQEMLCLLTDRYAAGGLSGLIVSAPSSKNYHAMLGLGMEQVLYVLLQAAREYGYDQNESLVAYARAFLYVVRSTYPLSLPAIVRLAEMTDEQIAGIGRGRGLSEELISDIAGNRQAGRIFRIAVQNVQSAFALVTEKYCASGYNLQSGAVGGQPLMVFYQYSSRQSVMNLYLKEEIYNVMRRVGRCRIILDEAAFVPDQDALLNFLMEQKRIGQIELAAVSANASAMLQRPENLESFRFIAVFPHMTDAATEAITKMFGEYEHHKETMAGGEPPNMLITFRRDTRWNITMNSRLRVRAADLRREPGLFRAQERVALKMGDASGEIELVQTGRFLNRDF